MQGYYPPIKPYTSHQFAVAKPHKLYIEECGNPQGLPILVLPDGLGIGCDDHQRRFFDPDIYRIILLDLRGCGHSSPHNELRDNNTQTLLSDIDAVRRYLHIEQWILFGGAWGSTLALLYAQMYPQHIQGLILHSVFLGREQDIAWFYRSGANQIFPDHWQEFISIIPKAEHNDLIHAYHQRLHGDDEIAQMIAAKHWVAWHNHCASLQPNQRLNEHTTIASQSLNATRIATHYLLHRLFLQDNHILQHMQRIHAIPATIVHGRYDMICPMHNAWELHQHYSNAEFFMVREAGHSAAELAIIDALIQASKSMAAWQTSKNL